MAICNSTRAHGPLDSHTVNSISREIRIGPNPLPRHLSRIYRAHVSPPSIYGPERTAFVEAFSHRDAARKIAAVVAGLEDRTPDAVERRIYNVSSARELIDDGISDDIELRLLETDWGAAGVSFVQEPLFLLTTPAGLIRKWAALRREEVSHD